MDTLNWPKVGRHYTWNRFKNAAVHAVIEAGLYDRYREGVRKHKGMCYDISPMGQELIIMMSEVLNEQK